MSTTAEFGVKATGHEELTRLTAALNKVVTSLDTLQKEVKILTSSQIEASKATSALTDAQRAAGKASRERQAATKAQVTSIHSLVKAEKEAAAVMSGKVAVLQNLMSKETAYQRNSLGALITAKASKTTYSLLNATLSRHAKIKGEVAALTSGAIQKMRTHNAALQKQHAILTTSETLEARLHKLKLESIALSNKKVQTLMREVKAQEALNVAQKKAVLGIKNVEKSQNNAAKSSKNLVTQNANLHSALRGVSGALGNLWMTYGNILPLMAAFAVAAGGKQFIQWGTDFEKTMKTIQGLSGETGAAIDEISRSLLSINAIEGPNKLAEGMKIMAKAGVDAKDSIQGIEAVSLLATNGEIGMAEAAKMATRVMRTFSMEASQLPEIADMIAYTASSANMEVSEMGTSFSYVTELATLMDISLVEVSAAIAILHDKGISGSKAGMSLRTSLLRLAAPTDKASDALFRLGVSAFDTEGNVKEMVPMIGDLSDAMQGLSKQQEVEFMENIAGKRSLKALQELVTAFREGRLEDKIKELNEESVGFLNTYKSIISESSKVKFKDLASDVETFTVKLAKFSSLDQGLGGIAEGFSGLIKLFDGILDRLEKLNKKSEIRASLRPDPAEGYDSFITGEKKRDVPTRADTLLYNAPPDIVAAANPYRSWDDAKERWGETQYQLYTEADLREMVGGWKPTPMPSAEGAMQAFRGEENRYSTLPAKTPGMLVSEQVEAQKHQFDVMEEQRNHDTELNQLYFEAKTHTYEEFIEKERALRKKEVDILIQEQTSKKQIYQTALQGVPGSPTERLGWVEDIKVIDTELERLQLRKENLEGKIDLEIEVKNLKDAEKFAATLDKLAIPEDTTKALSSYQKELMRTNKDIDDYVKSVGGAAAASKKTADELKTLRKAQDALLFRELVKQSESLEDSYEKMAFDHLPAYEQGLEKVNQKYDVRIEQEVELLDLLVNRMKAEAALGNDTSGLQKLIDQSEIRLEQYKKWQVDAVKTYIKEHDAGAKAITKIWEGAADQMEDALTGFFRTGKFDLDSLVDYFKNAAAQMAAAWVMQMAGLRGPDGTLNLSIDSIGNALGGVGAMSLISDLFTNSGNLSTLSGLNLGYGVYSNGLDATAQGFASWDILTNDLPFALVDFSSNLAGVAEVVQDFGFKLESVPIVGDMGLGGAMNLYSGINNLKAGNTAEGAGDITAAALATWGGPLGKAAAFGWTAGKLIADWLGLGHKADPEGRFATTNSTNAYNEEFTYYLDKQGQLQDGYKYVTGFTKDWGSSSDARRGSDAVLALSLEVMKHWVDSLRELETVFDRDVMKSVTIGKFGINTPWINDEDLQTRLPEEIGRDIISGIAVSLNTGLDDYWDRLKESHGAWDYLTEDLKTRMDAAIDALPDIEAGISTEDFGTRLNEFKLGTETFVAVFDQVQAIIDGLSDNAAKVSLSDYGQAVRSLAIEYDKLIPQMETLGIKAEMFNFDLKEMQDRIRLTAQYFKPLTDNIVRLGDASGDTLTLYQQYRSAAMDVSRLAAYFDGTTYATQELNSAVGVYLDTQQRYLDFLKSASAQIEKTYLSSIETFQLDMLDTQGQYDFYQDKVAELYSQVNSASSLEEVSELMDLINQYGTTAWGLLDDQQKQLYGDEFITSFDSLMQEALAKFEGMEEVTDFISGSVQDRLIRTFETTAPSFVESSNVMWEASNRMAEAVNTFIEAAGNLEATVVLNTTEPEVY